ncbi:MAG: hypothetical protein JKX76_02590 [Colwellia sp.]|nr:hypothetical protein [Colwellia sp.]
MNALKFINLVRVHNNVVEHIINTNCLFVHWVEEVKKYCVLGNIFQQQSTRQFLNIKNNIHNMLLLSAEHDVIEIFDWAESFILFPILPSQHIINTAGFMKSSKVLEWAAKRSIFPLLS